MRLARVLHGGTRIGSVQGTIMTPEDRHDWTIQKLQQRAGSRPDDWDVRTDLAEALFQKAYYFDAGAEWYERAEALAREILEAHGATARVLDVIAGCRFGMGDTDEAEAYYVRALEADPEDALAKVGMGNLHRERGNLARAIEAFRQAVKLDGELWQAHYNLGQALHLESKARDFRGADPLMEEAIFHLVTALKQEPFPGFMGNLYKSLGELFLYTRQYEHAQRFFKKLVDHPDFGHLASFYLGLAYLSLNKPKNAIAYFRTYLQKEPDSAIAYSKIALCYLEVDRFEQAREACEQALHSEPGNVMARFTRGCTAMAEGNFGEASRDFESILDEDPDYFPAYVEAVKVRFLRGDYRWLFESLSEEIRVFEGANGYDGGRGYYKGPRGRQRRRIDVLLAQIKQVGLPAFGSLSRVLQEVSTDSLRFQIWEDLYELSRRRKVETLAEELRGAEHHFGPKLGRAALMLSHYLSEEAIVGGFEVSEEALKRRAHETKAAADDVGAYAEALEHARADRTRYQAYLLLALAVKGSPTAEEFLVDHLEGGDPVLRNSAAIALLFYGHEGAIQLLDEEAREVPEERRATLGELLEMGRSRKDEKRKVIDLSTAARGEVMRPDPPPRRRSMEDHEHYRCSLCGRTQDQVDRLMSGNRMLLCNVCVSAIHDHRDDLAVPDDEEHVCHLCRSSIFEVQSMYRIMEFLVCNVCLDQCVGLLRREEVDRFLKDFS